MRACRNVSILLVSPRKNSESGFALIWAALMLTTLLGICGFSVDLGNWYLHIERAQRAADSAALDGAVFLPGDVLRARDAAIKGLIANGLSAQEANAAAIAPIPGHSDQLSVTISTSVTDTFLGFLGIDPHHTFLRRGIATTKPSLHMNQGSNMLGTYYPGTAWGPVDNSAGHYWITIDGADVNKVDGDRFATRSCAGAGERVDNCRGNRNDEYTGHYDVNVSVRPQARGGVLRTYLSKPLTQAMHRQTRRVTRSDVPIHATTPEFPRHHRTIAPETRDPTCMRLMPTMRAWTPSRRHRRRRIPSETVQAARYATARFPEPRTLPRQCPTPHTARGSTNG